MPALVKMVRLRGPCYFRGTRDFCPYTCSIILTRSTIQLKLLALRKPSFRPMDAPLGWAKVIRVSPLGMADGAPRVFHVTGVECARSQEFLTLRRPT